MQSVGICGSDVHYWVDHSFSFIPELNKSSPTRNVVVSEISLFENQWFLVMKVQAKCLKLDQM